MLWEDWQPAITSNSLTIFIDTPNMSTTNVTNLTASWLEKLIMPGVSELSKTFGIANNTSIEYKYRDFLYGSKPISRERYIYDYDASRGVLWGEAGETTFPIAGIGQRPALSFSTELLYVTYCDTW